MTFFVDFESIFPHSAGQTFEFAQKKIMRTTQNHFFGSLCAAMLILVGTGTSHLAQAELLLTSLSGQGTNNIGSFTLTANYITNLVKFTDRALFMSEQAPTGYVGVLGVQNGVGGGYLVDYDGHIRAGYTNTPAGRFTTFVEFGPDGLGCPNCNAYVSYGNTSGNLGVVERYSFFGADLGPFTSGYAYDRSTAIYFNGAYMYLIDYQVDTVVRFNATTGVRDAAWSITGPHGSTTLTFMPGSTNDLLITTDFGSTVKHYKLTATGGTDLGIFANPGAVGSGSSVNEMAYGPDGNLYVNDTSGHNPILVFNGTNGALLAGYSPNVAGFSNGEGLAFIIPEPATFSLMGLGLLSLFLSRRNRRRALVSLNR
jgi:hypothetical protein